MDGTGYARSRGPIFLCMHFSEFPSSHDVRFASASRKLSMQLLEFPHPIVTLEQKTRKKTHAKYVVNKGYAIEATKKYLEVMEDYASMSLLDAYKKKDDMCDSFLQAIAFVENSLRPQDSSDKIIYDIRHHIRWLSRTKMDDLPRDVFLHIVKKLDMDARIKLGLVFKLDVPVRLLDLMDLTMKTPFFHKRIYTVESGRGAAYYSFTEIRLGRIHNTLTRARRYIIRKYDDGSSIVLHNTMDASGFKTRCIRCQES